jgi:probable HAF family extracellular repeat protein
MGINARGDIVGVYTSANKTNHGFLWSDGTCTTIDFPGAKETRAWKITSRGRVLGGYVGSDSRTHDFTLSEGQFTTIDLPGAAWPTLDTGGINDHEEIAGWYCDTPVCAGAGDIHGFLLNDDGFTIIEVPGFTCVTPLAINSHGNLVGAYSTNAACTDLHGFLLIRKDEKEIGLNPTHKEMHHEDDMRLRASCSVDFHRPVECAANAD